MQIPDFWSYYKKSKLDGLLWMVTFVGVVLTTVDRGLVICLVMTVLVMSYRNYDIKITEIDQSAFAEEELKDENSDSDEHDEDVDKIEECDLENPEENTLTLKLTGGVSFANYEKVLKQLNKRLKRHRQKVHADKDEMAVSIKNDGILLFIENM